MDPQSLIESIADEMERQNGVGGAPSMSRTERIACVGAMLEALQRAGEIDALFFASPDVLRRIAEATAPKTSGLPEILGGLRRIIATLVHDSRSGGVALAGFRGGTGERRFAFEGDGFRMEADVRAAPARGIAMLGEEELEILGRVSSSMTLHAVRFIDQRGIELSAEIDDTSFFEIRLKAASYRVEFEGDSGEVVIERVVLEPMSRA